MTILLHLQESVDIQKIAKKAVSVSEIRGKQTAFQVLRGGEDPDLDLQLKGLAAEGTEELHLYFPESVFFNGVDVSDQST